MKLKEFTLLIIALLLSVMCRAQNATVLTDETSINVNSDLRGYTVKCTCSCLLKDEKAKGLADFVGQFDNEHRLSSFEGTVKTGNFTKKIKKSDLKRTEYSEELASDGYTLYSDFIPPSYPAMVTYTYVINVDDEMMTLPSFSPVPAYDVNVAHSSWTMTCPADFKYHYTIRGNGIVKSQSTDAKGNIKLTFTADSIKSLTSEPLSRSLAERAPRAFVAPDTIIFHGTTGSNVTWKSLGLWHYNLAVGRQNLPPDAIAAIHAAADTCSTVYGKIAALKKLMDSRTHYVSIQLGIGGYQPMNAADTWRLGYGDCKGLSNLMKAMLEVVGIDSKLVAINLGSKFFCKELPSLRFFNHMILEVPLAKDTCWVECTSDKLPAGYVHEDIAGHNALEFGPDGGRIVVLPVYPDSTNVNYVTTDIKLGADGNAQVVIDDKAQNRFYEHEVALLTLDHDKMVKVANSNYNLTGANINNVIVTDNTKPGGCPTLTMHIDANCKYARLAGKRMFVNIDPEGSSSFPDIKPERTEDIYLNCGYKLVKTTTFHVPEGFSIEALPRNYDINNAFGSFSLNIKKIGNDVTVSKIFFLKSGTYPKSLAKELINFFNQVKNVGNSRIVFVKA